MRRLIRIYDTTLRDGTHGEETWGTVGVADNIIEASWRALVDSIEYKLRRDERQSRIS